MKTAEERAAELVFARGNTWWCDYAMGDNKSLVTDIAAAIREAEERGMKREREAAKELEGATLDLVIAIGELVGPFIEKGLMTVPDGYIAAIETAKELRADKNDQT